MRGGTLLEGSRHDGSPRASTGAGLEERREPLAGGAPLGVEIPEVGGDPSAKGDLANQVRQARKRSPFSEPRFATGTLSENQDTPESPWAIHAWVEADRVL
jgi:hypothetical protein